MKELLSQWNVPYEVRDVKENESYMDELQKMGASTVPTVQVGEELIIGGRPNKLKDVLTHHGYEVN